MGAQFALINGAACRYSVSGHGNDTLVLVHETRRQPEQLGRVRRADAGRHPHRPLRPARRRHVRKAQGYAGLRHAGRRYRRPSRPPRHHRHGRCHGRGRRRRRRRPVRDTPFRADRRLVLLAPALAVPEDRRAGGRATADLVESEGMRAVADIILPQAFPGNLWRSEEQKATALARWYGADPEGYAAMYRALNNHGVLDEVSAIALPHAGARRQSTIPSTGRTVSAKSPTGFPTAVSRLSRRAISRRAVAAGASGCHQRLPRVRELTFYPSRPGLSADIGPHE